MPRRLGPLGKEGNMTMSSRRLRTLLNRIAKLRQWIDTERGMTEPRVFRLIRMKALLLKAQYQLMVPARG